MLNLLLVRTRYQVGSQNLPNKKRLKIDFFGVICLFSKSITITPLAVLPTNDTLLTYKYIHSYISKCQNLVFEQTKGTGFCIVWVFDELLQSYKVFL